MNRTLFVASIKTQGKNLFSYAFGAVIYEWLIIWIYPSIAGSSATSELLKSMPSSVLKAFGMQGGIQQFGDYLAAEFYGLLYLLILAVFVISSAIQLLVRLVDRGSMAYLLATPSSRVQVAVSQASVLLVGLFVICMFTTIGGIAGASIFVKHSTFHVGPFIQMNLTGFLLFTVIGAFTFLCSCLMNDEKRALGVAAVVTVVSYAMHLMATLTNQLDWMKYLSIFSTFNPETVMKGQIHVFPTELGLGLATLLLFVIAVQGFKRRDLPL